jgi:hypothetical protein
MGLLDDAIREHLDLKRRRGADPVEVARLEQEALGPVRREPAAGGAAPPDEAARDEPPAAAQPDAHDAGHVLAPEDGHDPPHGDALFEHEAGLGGAAAPASASAHDEQHTPQPAPEPPRPRGDARHSDVVEQPTTEYRVEDHHDDEDEHETGSADRPHHDDHRPPAQESEDVLEETPEFLQETPEHDRLWFEQRPPRDFDFDG